ncbi:MAG: cyclic nucleotide-binding domain-containing protein [Bacteroidetes bacterium]|nr:cyclic nucleotide-binding domain-containing protein [Bacteroidota bacterium]MBS1541857.1 cyclic nucleotide-binding domain-containing protein [Bacteroidota bacterium]
MNKSTLIYIKPKTGEQKQVALMLTTGFFLGIYVATYQVTAESLFLSQMSNQINNAFLASGVLGIVFTLVFSYFQNKIRFGTLTIISITSVAVVTFLVYYLYRFGNPALHQYVLFAMHSLSGPITAVLLLCYWGIFGRLFNFRQSKRIIGWIDTGQLVAIILANFFIPLAASFFPNTSDYLLMSNVSIVAGLVFVIIITSRFKMMKNDPREFDDTVKKETRFQRMFKDKYIVLLAVFLSVSMVTFMFNQFSFQTLLNTQYPVQRDLTNFLAYFNGIIYLLSLILQTFVNDRIISTYGLRVSLLMLPIVTLIFSMGSFITATFFGFSPGLYPQAYILFFLFIALTRLFNTTLRDSLENPVYKLLFIPLDSRYRFGIQSKVEGIVNESGRLIAGLAISGFGLLSFFQISWIPPLVVLLCVAYMLLARNLYAGYKNKIRSKLESSEFHQDKLEVGFAQITSSLEAQLGDQQTSKAVFSFKLLEKLNPSKVGMWVNSLFKNEREEIKEYAQRRMNELKGLSVSENYVIRIDPKLSNTENKKILSLQEIDQMLKSGGEITRSRIQKLSRSVAVVDRQYAAELILHSTLPENLNYLVELLSDNEPTVRRIALATAAQRFNSEIINAVIENLNNPQYSNLAMSTLTQMGSKALSYLESGFYLSGQNTQTMIRIIQVFGRIGGQRAKELLWNKIDFPDKVVVSSVLVALGEAGFKAGVSQITHIKYAIEADVSDIAWNLSAIKELGDERSDQVKLSLRQEINHDIEHIYMLLAMLYDTKSIQLVKENIESGTSEGTTYAVELLDIFLSEQLKIRVIPVLDDINDNEKISRLESFYPRVSLDQKLTLKFLINRDFTQTNRWTRATVINQIGKQKIADFSLDLMAQLFNPDRLIREVAGWALYQIDPRVYHESTSRLEGDHKRWLDRAILKKSNDNKLMLYERTVFFQSIHVFAEIPGLVLSYLSDIAREHHLKPEAFLSVDERLNNEFFIVFSGTLQYYENGKYVTDFEQGQFVGEMLSVPGFVNTNLLIAKEETILLKINKDQFYELLSDHVKLADKVLQFI